MGLILRCVKGRQDGEAGLSQLEECVETICSWGGNARAFRGSAGKGVCDSRAWWGPCAALSKAFQLRKSLCVLNIEPADEDKDAGGGAS